MSSTPLPQDKEFLERAIALSAEHMRAKDGGPFGAIIVRQNEIIGSGWNKVTSTNDPTAHAEITAIREAATRLGTFVLSGCAIYSSCEPCPMCLGAIYWARVDRIIYAATRADAAGIGFDDEELYRQLTLPIASRKLPMQQILRDKALEVFSEWRKMPGKVMY